MCNSVLSKICLLLAIIGGLNWGLVGIWKLDIIAWLLGGLIGLGTLLCAFALGPFVQFFTKHFSEKLLQYQPGKGVQ